MKRPTQLALVVVILVTASAYALLMSASGDQPRDAVKNAGTSSVVGSDPRILGDPGSSDVTFVEFLDFECEACGAAYPIVEDLRRQYAGRVTFAVRYFPIPSHFNAMRAARAVESAARQGKLEEMYSKMYTTQKTWAEARTPRDTLFRSFAADIGLDMTRFDADYDSPAVEKRIQRDVDAGAALGVEGTPTFYVDGKLFSPQTVQDFSTVLDQALTQRGK